MYSIEKHKAREWVSGDDGKTIEDVRIDCALEINDVDVSNDAVR